MAVDPRDRRAHPSITQTAIALACQTTSDPSGTQGSFVVAQVSAHTTSVAAPRAPVLGRSERGTSVARVFGGVVLIRLYAVNGWSRALTVRFEARALCAVVPVCAMAIALMLVACSDGPEPQPGPTDQALDPALRNGPFNGQDPADAIAANSGGVGRGTPARRAPRGTAGAAMSGARAGAGASAAGPSARGAAGGSGGDARGSGPARAGAGASAAGGTGGSARGASPGAAGGARPASGSEDSDGWYCGQSGEACACVQDDNSGLADTCTEPRPTCCFTLHVDGASDSCICWPEDSPNCGNLPPQAEKTDQCPPA